MELDKIEILKSNENILSINDSIMKIYDIIMRECILDIDDSKWQGSAKGNFINSLNKLNEELIDYSDLLNQANVTMNDVLQAQTFSKEIKRLEEENVTLKLSNHITDKNKLMENELNIEMLKEKIKKIESSITQKWR